MNTATTARLAALALALSTTLAMVAGIGTLADASVAGVQLAAVAAPALHG